MRRNRPTTTAGTERFSVDVHIAGAEDYVQSSTTAEYDTEAAALRAAAEYVAARLYPIHHIVWLYADAFNRSRPSWGCIPYEGTAQVAMQDRAAFGRFVEFAETLGYKGRPHERRAGLLLRGIALLHGMRDAETARSYFVRLARQSEPRSQFLATAFYELALCDYATRNWAGSLRHLGDADKVLQEIEAPDGWIAHLSAIDYVRMAVVAPNRADECSNLDRAVEAIDSLFTPPTQFGDDTRLVHSQIHFLRLDRCRAEEHRTSDRRIAVEESEALLVTSMENPYLFIWRLRLGRLLEAGGNLSAGREADVERASAAKHMDYSLRHWPEHVELLVEVAKTHERLGRSADALAIRRTAATKLCQMYVHFGRRGVSFADKGSEACRAPQDRLMAARCGQAKDVTACGPTEGLIADPNSDYFGINAEAMESELRGVLP